MLRDEIMESIKPVPQKRIMEKMNEYMSRRDYAGAERHLLYWLAEAELGRDLQGMLMLRNEMVGHYRKTGERDKAMESAGKALELLTELGMEDAISAGTTYVNVATACNAFGEYERSMGLFEKAREVYEGSGFVEPQMLGGLYNNMALTCSALGRYDEALELLNMANTVEAQAGLEEGESRICGLVERAEELLERKGEEILGLPGAEGSILETPGALRGLPREERARIGYYAFVCEKCAPTFEYYGYFLAAETLRERAEKIYAEE